MNISLFKYASRNLLSEWELVGDKNVMKRQRAMDRFVISASEIKKAIAESIKT